MRAAVAVPAIRWLTIWSNNVSGAPIVPADMVAALEAFDQNAEKIIASFVGPLDSEPPPPIIYHYTNDVGLRGILETGKIWLTDIFNLNDPSELSHGFSHIVEILKGMAASGPPEVNIFAQDTEAFATRGGIRAAAHYFVCSFSAAGDDLGQWRAYADNGRGYALGFDAKMLEAAYIGNGSTLIPNNSTFPITYADAQLADLHRQIAEAALPLISLPRGRELSNDVIRAYMRELSVLVSMHALRAVLFFKHEAYNNEREYRFLQIHRADIPAPDVKFRSRPYALVRYREFDWNAVAADALKTIIIGPAADSLKATQFAQDCIASFAGRSVEVIPSKIPYRAT